jgi:hypothetical protein
LHVQADSINELEAGIAAISFIDKDRCSRAAHYWLVLNFFPVVNDTCAEHVEAGWDQVFRSLQVFSGGWNWKEIF